MLVRERGRLENAVGKLVSSNVELKSAYATDPDPQLKAAFEVCPPGGGGEPVAGDGGGTCPTLF